VEKVTVETSDPSYLDFSEIEEDLRPGELPRSVHTSADLKILYVEESDSFEVAITETNAFPEAQEYCDRIHDEDWIGNTVEALTSHLPEDGADVVVNLPSHAFDGEHGWLEDEKTAITERLEGSVDRTRTTIGGEDLNVTYETVRLNGEEFDYVINLSDVGDDLNDALSGPGANSRIVNAPTAVWNTRYPETGKAGLQDSAEQVVQDLGIDGVHVPENSSVEYREEAVEATRELFEQGDSAVLKGDFGTHGDEVVYLDRKEYENLSQHFGLSLSDYVKSRVSEVEDRVRDKSTVDPGYSLFDASGQFNGRGESNTAVVEKAVEGEVKIDGETAEVLEYDGRPIDLVFTVWDVGDEYRIGSTIRASDKDDTINANCGSDNFDLVPYDQAFEEGIYKDGNGPPLEDLLEEVAGRPVERSELMEYTGPVAEATLGTRNLSAYRAEDRQIH
jgi:hypothetical protein